MVRQATLEQAATLALLAEQAQAAILDIPGLRVILESRAIAADRAILGLLALQDTVVFRELLAIAVTREHLAHQGILVTREHLEQAALERQDTLAIAVLQAVLGQAATLVLQGLLATQASLELERLAIAATLATLERQAIRASRVTLVHQGQLAGLAAREPADTLATAGLLGRLPRLILSLSLAGILALHSP